MRALDHARRLPPIRLRGTSGESSSGLRSLVAAYLTLSLEVGVDDDTLIRNSRTLGILDQVLHGQLGSLRTVELVGRGIAAEARCTQAALDDKMRVSSDPLEVAVQRGLKAADLLTDLGVIEDDLTDAWHRRRTNELNDPTFEAELGRVVARLEAWPGRWRAVGSA